MGQHLRIAKGGQQRPQKSRISILLQGVLPFRAQQSNPVLMLEQVPLAHDFPPRLQSQIGIECGIQLRGAYRPDQSLMHILKLGFGQCPQRG